MKFRLLSFVKNSKLKIQARSLTDSILNKIDGTKKIEKFYFDFKLKSSTIHIRRSSCGPIKIKIISPKISDNLADPYLWLSVVTSLKTVIINLNPTLKQSLSVALVKTVWYYNYSVFSVRSSDLQNAFLLACLIFTGYQSLVGKINTSSGVGMSGALVPMLTGVPAGTHQKFKILGTAGYRVPRKFQKLGTAGYRVSRKFQELGTARYLGPARKNFWVPMGTRYRPNFTSCRPFIVSIRKFMT